MQQHGLHNAVQQIQFPVSADLQVRIGLYDKWSRFVSTEIGDRALERVVERVRSIGTGNVKVTGCDGTFRLIFMNAMGRRFVPPVEVQCVNWKVKQYQHSKVWVIREGRNTL